MSNLQKPTEVYSYPPVPGSKKIEALYIYSEYPCGMHNSNGRHTIANDAEHQAMLEGQGWSRKEFAAPEPKVEMCPNCQRVADRAEGQLALLASQKEALDAEYQAVQAAFSQVEASLVELNAEYVSTHESYVALDAEHNALKDTNALVDKLNRELRESHAAFEAANKELADKVAALEAKSHKK
jgi:septal ring factor EnvC (AmiA/AmiB activator)